MISRLRKFGTYGVDGLGDSTTNALAAAITKVEGYAPPGGCIGTTCYPNGTLAYQNNNPGNLRYVVGGYNYPGATPGAGGFAQYPDLATGQAALQHQIQFQINSGQNLTQFFGVYAPPNENNTKNYINTVAAQTGIDPSVPIANYQNGTASAGASTSPSDAFDSTTYPTDGGMSADPTNPSATPTTSITDTLNNMDPVTVGAVGIGIAGILYVLFG